MVIAFVNHKGGVGKTTCTLNIGAGLARAGKSVLLIDADAQANLSTSLGLTDDEPITLYDVLYERNTLEEAIIHRDNEMDIVPSCLDLSLVESELTNAFEKERLLRYALEPVREHYEYILIDCPPAFDLCTKNALVAADKIYIPVSAEFLPLKGLSKILEYVNLVRKKRANPTLTVAGVIVTRYNKQQTICRQVVEVLQEQFPNQVFTTYIRENVALKEFPAAGQDIFRYAPNSLAAKDYGSLVEEVLQQILSTSAEEGATK